MLDFRPYRSVFVLALLVTPVATSLVSRPINAQQIPSSEILSRAASNAEEIGASFDRLARYEEVTIQAVGVGNNVTGEYYRLSRFFRDRTERTAEKVFEEKSTLPSDAFFSIAAVRRMLRIYRFNITRQVLEQYEFNYIGRERIDELNTLVFDVKPKDKILSRATIESRMLKGQVWIDDQDLQVVKVKGEILPHSRPDRTPRFETYFKNYDRYWLPAYTYADEDLQMSDGSARVIIKVREYGFGNGGQP
jgi:hypothetical protein